MTPSSQPPQHGVASAQDAGGLCPYCCFPLKQGTEIVRCGACGAPHHTDCWSENDGCAVVGCTGTTQVHDAAPPTDATTQPLTPPPPAPSPPAAQPIYQPPPPPNPPVVPAAAAGGGSGPRQSGPWIIAGAIVLALALAGGAFAVVLSGSGSSDTRTIISVQQSDPAPPATEGADDGTATTEAPPTDDGLGSGYPPADETAREQIEQLLLEHHQDIVDGNLRGAWDLLSGRKQAQKLREEGYSAWADNQQTLLSPYLVPSGLHVEFEAYDRSTGVARVLVTGMGWTRPNTCGGRYEGLTWVKFENGAWRYDPGYSTTPEREQIWSSRPQPYDQLLGTQCE